MREVDFRRAGVAAQMLPANGTLAWQQVAAKLYLHCCCGRPGFGVFYDDTIFSLVYSIGAVQGGLSVSGNASVGETSAMP